MGPEWVLFVAVALYVVAALMTRIRVHDHPCEPCDDEEKRKRDAAEVWEHKAWHRYFGDDGCPLCKDE